MLVWFGLIWRVFISFDSVWFGLIWFDFGFNVDLNWFDFDVDADLSLMLIWFGLILFGLIWCWCGVMLVCIDLIRVGLVFFLMLMLIVFGVELMWCKLVLFDVIWRIWRDLSLIWLWVWVALTLTWFDLMWFDLICFGVDVSLK